MTSYTTLDTPVGKLWLSADAHGLRAVGWRKVRDPISEEDAGHPVLKEAVRQLKEYFAGRRRAFSLPLAPAGTEFQKRAWSELAKIPYGETIHYGEQARRLGQPGAMRAVGTANGKNPLAIVIPCHRVIAAGGGLGGFSGGLEAKRKLLGLEAPQSSLL